MTRTRRALLFGLLILMPALAGCNVKDWYNQIGTVRLELSVQDEKTALRDFRSVKVALYGASLRQAGSAETKHFTFGEDPLIVDLVEKAGERIPVAEFKTNMRATDRLAVRLVTFEAITAAGNSLEICRVTDQPESFPCFYQPDNSALLYEEKPFAPPRGGEVVVGFPVAVRFAQMGRVSEYFLSMDPHLIVLENHR